MENEITDANHTSANIHIGIYEADGTPYEKDGTPFYVTLNQGNGWEVECQMNDIVKDQYRVKELKPCETGETAEFTIGGIGYKGMDAGAIIQINGVDYTVSYKDLNTATQTVVNSEKNYGIRVLEKSETTTGPALQGVKFALYDQTGTQIGTTGITDAEGILLFGDLSANPEGSVYFLQEVETVEGYSLLGCIQKITMWPGSAGKVAYTIEAVASMENPTITASKADAVEATDAVVEMTIVNYKLYSLPSSGREGILWYVFSGMLLMMGAALMIYKKKCREVLES